MTVVLAREVSITATANGEDLCAVDFTVLNQRLPKLVKPEPNRSRCTSGASRDSRALTTRFRGSCRSYACFDQLLSANCHCWICK